MMTQVPVDDWEVDISKKKSHELTEYYTHDENIQNKAMGILHTLV